MTDRRLRVFHIFVTCQFVASAAMIIFWSLWRSGLRWWAVFSISAHGLVVLVLCAFTYAFAVFCGSLGQREEMEHPLTGSFYYHVFYLVVPVLAGFAGSLDYLWSEGIREAPRGLALGTVASAYGIWLIIDPIVALAEHSLPHNRRMRRQRAEEERRARRDRSRLVEQVSARRAAALQAVRASIDQSANGLATLLTRADDDPRHGFDDAALAGLEAWRAGGIDAMRELYKAALSRLDGAYRPRAARTLDYWWDGVGQWRMEDSPPVA